MTWKTKTGGLVGLLVTAMAAVAVVTAVVIFIAAALAMLAALATAIVAYMRRDRWARPAYRWTRDRTGQWSFTPWSASSDGGPVPEPTPAAPVEETAA